jgi:fluoride ion exporter CrcB/FEX
MRNLIRQFLLVAAFSYVGVILRIYLTLLLEIHYQYTPTTETFGVLDSVFIPNLVGCFIMGLMTKFKNAMFFRRYYPLYLGIVSGGLGSLTTFSTWNVEVSLKLIEYRSAFNGLLCLLISYATCLMAYKCGNHIADGCQYLYRRSRSKKAKEKVHTQSKEPSQLTSHRQRVFDLLCWLSWAIPSALFLVLLFILSPESQEVPVACLIGNFVSVDLFFRSVAAICLI